MNILLRLFLVGWLLSLAAGGRMADEIFEDLPFGCFVTSSKVIPAAQRDEVGRKLGSPLKKLSNTWLQVQGRRVLVNVFDLATTEQARALHESLLKLRGNPAVCRLRGKQVFEFCKVDATAAIKAAMEMGLVEKPENVRYRIRAELALADDADGAESTEMLNLILQSGGRETPRIRELREGFSFGKSLALRDGQAAGWKPEFTPGPAGVGQSAGGRVAYQFDGSREFLGMPCVRLEAEIACDASGLTKSDRRADESLLAATDAWPVEDPAVKRLAREITRGKRTPEDKVQAILEWLAPGKNIRSEGPLGSRWGVNKVLEKRIGHCWDTSDCFVSFARAAGVPCRQVGGWLYGSSGHIWAEYLVKGKGWMQVDPSGAGRLECGIYHIPYFTTESGKMPILYLSMPQIEMVAP